MRSQVCFPWAFGMICSCWVLKTVSQQQNLSGGFSFVSNFNIGDVTCEGSSRVAPGGYIDLTPLPSGPQAGRCFYNQPIKLRDENGSVQPFSVSFIYRIRRRNYPHGMPTHVGEGLAFFIVSEVASFPVNSYGGLNIGLMNYSMPGQSSTFQKTLEFADLDDNHIGIGVRSVDSVLQAYLPLKRNPTQNLNEEDIRVWIDYDAGQNMNVYVNNQVLNKPQEALLTLTSNFLDAIKETSYIGVSGATGFDNVGDHFILALSFSLNGTAEFKCLTAKCLDSFPTLNDSFPTNNRRNTWTVGQMYLLVGFSLVGMMCFCRCIHPLKSIRKKSDSDKPSRHAVLTELEDCSFLPRKFLWQEVIVATRNFDPNEVLGSGGYGTVYKGFLPNRGTLKGTLVAVKRMTENSDQAFIEFVAEVKIIVRLRHRNLVRLLGWCHDHRSLVLVYEYMPNGSLDRFLFSDNKENGVLSWDDRLNILRGVASALVYLHENCEVCVVHRDVKASNVMLDADFNARLGDFGLAQWYKHCQSPDSTLAAGTYGYLAPEISNFTGGRVKFTDKTDVYSFGSLVLEVACGKEALDMRRRPEEVKLVDWVWDLQRKDRIMDAADAFLGGDYDAEEMNDVLRIGLLCSHPDPFVRPPMSQVLHLLTWNAPLPPVPRIKPLVHVPSSSPVFRNPHLRITLVESPEIPRSSTRNQSPLGKWLPPVPQPRNNHVRFHSV